MKLIDYLQSYFEWSDAEKEALREKYHIPLKDVLRKNENKICGQKLKKAIKAKFPNESI